MTVSDHAYIEVNGEILDVWDEYSIDSDLTVPADGFSFQVSLPGDRRSETRSRRRQYIDLLKPGADVKVFVGASPSSGLSARYAQMVGIIDDRRATATASGGTVISVEGRDLAGVLTDASVDLRLALQTDMTLVSLIRAAVAPYDIPVSVDAYASQQILQGSRRGGPNAAAAAGLRIDSFSLTAQDQADATGRPLDEIVGARTDESRAASQARAAARASLANGLDQSDVSRLRVRDAAPQAGETVWTFCQRHCARLGVLMWMSPRGRLILSSPRYTQTPRYRAIRRFVPDPSDTNTILDGGLQESIGDRYSDVTVYGRRAPTARRSPVVVGTATDEAWPSSRRKPYVMAERSIKTNAEAARRALRELMGGQAKAFTLNYLLPDHGQGGYLYAVDSTITVVDEPSGVDGNFYITRRTFQKDEGSGTTTRLGIIPVGALRF